jgi:hypothetical protein
MKCEIPIAGTCFPDNHSGTDAERIHDLFELLPGITLGTLRVRRWRAKPESQTDKYAFPHDDPPSGEPCDEADLFAYAVQELIVHPAVIFFVWSQ